MRPQPVQDRQSKRGGLACARLRRADQITTGQNQRNGARLNGSRFTVSFGHDGGFFRLDGFAAGFGKTLLEAFDATRRIDKLLRARKERMALRADADAHVLLRIHRFARLGVLVALAVAVGVEHQRGPARSHVDDDAAQWLAIGALELRVIRLDARVIHRERTAFLGQFGQHLLGGGN